MHKYLFKNNILETFFLNWISKWHQQLECVLITCMFEFAYGLKEMFTQIKNI